MANESERQVESGHSRATQLWLDLDDAFSVEALMRAWKKSVRTGLRKQPFKDLHDYLDVHRHLRRFSERLRSDVLSGYYRPDSPEFALLEKRDGITRRLAIPGPADALALQCIVDALEERLKENQPSPNAYYSRSHTPASVEDVDSTFAYPWWILWPEFQQRIWQFTAKHEYLVVTDIANYFDCVPLASLRNAVASQGQFKEGLLDFLFYMLEAFTWRPFYMPPSGVGLPQINFDAPRLLAHMYLFRLDEAVHKQTSGDFVRWMDDINAGVVSREEGKRLVKALEEVLNSQGLRLNAAKTRILRAEEAVAHFQIQDNRALTIIENVLASGASDERESVARLLRKRFRAFRKKPRVGQWDKVYKRFFKLFGEIEDGYLQRNVGSVLDEVPSLRGAALRYLQVRGFNSRRLELIERFTMSGHCDDDVSLFECVACIVGWRVPVRGSAVARIVSLALQLSRKSGKHTNSGVTAALWLLTKYGSARELARLIRDSQPVWSKSQWAARQVAAATPRLSLADRRWTTTRIFVGGQLSALSVLQSLARMRSLSRPDPQLKSYLTHDPGDGFPYPLEKVLVAQALLQGEMSKDRKAHLRNEVIGIARDARYTRILRESADSQPSSRS